MADVDLSWFRGPLPKQAAFLRAMPEQDRRLEVVYAGGFGSGKTLVGCVKALQIALRFPGSVGCVVRQTYGALEDTTMKVALDGDDKPPVFPPSIVAERNNQQGRYRVKLTNGSEILFRAPKDFNPERIRSLNLGWFYVDECTETSEKIWLELMGRLRHPVGPGVGYGTTNPNGKDWVYRRFHPDSDQRVEDARMLIAPTGENVFLPPGYEDHLRRTMPAEWCRRFLDCSFEVAAGAVWPEWDARIHVVPPVTLPYDWQRFEAWDHGRRNPTAALRFAVDREGDLWVEDGYYAPGLLTDHLDGLLEMRERHGPRQMPAITADPSMWIQSPVNGRTIVDEYVELVADRGRAGEVAFRQANNSHAGLLRVSEWLLPRDYLRFPELHPRAGEGPAPRVYVLDVPGTLPLRTEVTEYRWRDLTPQVEATRDQPEEVRKKDDHACDAFRYGIMTRPRPSGPREPKDPDRPKRENPSRGMRTRKF